MSASQDRRPLLVERRGCTMSLVVEGSGTRDLANNGLGRQLTEALKAAQRDPAVHAVVIRGSGESLGNAGAEVDESVLADFTDALMLLRTLPLPTVAVVTGAVAGLGTAVVLACDLRLATPESTVTFSSMTTAGGPGIGLSWALLRELGRTRALELLYSPRALPAGEAHERGLLTRVASEEELDGYLDVFVADLARSGAAVARIKRSVIRAEAVRFEEALEFDFLLTTSPLMDS